jgi:hypothetical protein
LSFKMEGSSCPGDGEDPIDAQISHNIFHKNREISILTMKKKQQG